MNFKTRQEFDSEENYVRYLHCQENEYIKNIEEHIDKGVIHPMFSYWFEKSKDQSEKPTNSTKFKTRYAICKQCEMFNNFTKTCKKCYCFMPMKAQFEIFSCPIGKW